ncbi:hypothetical protein HOLleu_15802 [Holothuria leucospilota]|uniref:Uncharacterized protein n=1 Tax=Holothuria leucospilota TaxID=206669 RepID=A0A9Q1HAN5_HOLLE|nr:hypothetical protein HOLleu_15802 [Holothuria leucospilota]
MIVTLDNKNENGKECTAMVPEGWCVGENQCYWPPYTSSFRIDKAVSCMEPPKQDWDTYKIRILKKTSSFQKGRRYLKQSEETSDLQTDTDEYCSPQRKRHRK